MKCKEYEKNAKKARKFLIFRDHVKAAIEYRRAARCYFSEDPKKALKCIILSIKELQHAKKADIELFSSLDVLVQIVSSFPSIPPEINIDEILEYLKNRKDPESLYAAYFLARATGKYELAAKLISDLEKMSVSSDVKEEIKKIRALTRRIVTLLKEKPELTPSDVGEQRDDIIVAMYLTGKKVIRYNNSYVVLRDPSKDATELVTLFDNVITLKEAIKKTGWSTARIRAALEILEQEGLAVKVDNYASSEKWYIRH